MTNSIFGILRGIARYFLLLTNSVRNNEGNPMSNSTSKTNPMDDYENGIITFDDLCSIILAMPQRELTDEEQEYYRNLAEKAENGELGIGSNAKIYRGEEAKAEGRALFRVALEPS